MRRWRCFSWDRKPAKQEFHVRRRGDIRKGFRLRFNNRFTLTATHGDSSDPPPLRRVWGLFLSDSVPSLRRLLGLLSGDSGEWRTLGSRLEWLLREETN